MPSSPNYKRNYTQERLAESPKRKEDRNKRNKARRKLEKEGKVKKGDGKHVDHKTKLKNGGSNSSKNLRVRSASENSSDNGHKPKRKGKR